jgi:ubiquinone/menaquinone biosynthesis C-methylase UbiE
MDPAVGVPALWNGLPACGPEDTMTNATNPALHDRNADQIAFWDGPGGAVWTQRQDTQDRVLAPVTAAVLTAAHVSAGERVVDIGCGCGDTTIALAGQVGPAGHVLGLDVSDQMLARARERAPQGAPLDFVRADATVYPFQPAHTDLLFSRFGVMFFADPAASFANMRTGLKSGGRLAFACWREPKLNPWAMMPLQAVYKHAPRLPEMGPEDPGPFAFAREDRVRRILNAAGFSAIEMQPHDFAFDVAVGRGLDAAVQSALDIGPAMRALKDQPEAIRSAAAVSIREALAPFAKGQSVELAAAIWIVTARNP